MFGARDKCCKCNKTVYAVEKLTILDKIWHKWCFKCHVCGSTLTMKNYQALSGNPYCKAHYPAAGHSEDRTKAGDASASTPANYQAGVAPTVQVDLSTIQGRDAPSDSGYSGGSVAPPAQSYQPPPAAAAPPPAAAAAAPAADQGYEEQYYEEGEYYEEGGEYYEEGGEYYEEGYYEEGQY